MFLTSVEIKTWRKPLCKRMYIYLCLYEHSPCSNNGCQSIFESIRIRKDHNFVLLFSHRGEHVVIMAERESERLQHSSTASDMVLVSSAVELLAPLI